MGSMVGAYDTYASVVQGVAKGIAVGSLLDGRITLDECAQTAVVLAAPEQMRHTSLGCYLWVIGAEEFQFVTCGQMGHMQPGTSLARQPDRQRSALKAGHAVADVGMMYHLRVIAILGLRLLHAPVDAVGILAMRHEQGRAGGEDVA